MTQQAHPSYTKQRRLHNGKIILNLFLKGKPMQKFIGRKAELAALEESWNRPGFQMTVIYGRRRIGKSSLIREFIKNRRAIYFAAIRSGFSKNMERLGREVLKVLNPGSSSLGFPDLDTMLTYTGRECREERTVLVIDELPYLAEADPSFLSVLQNYIDGEWADSQIFLILCGSSVSFMENEVLSAKSPLFGRRTSQIRLDVFNYLEAAEFVPDYTREEQAIVYGVTGGVAWYLSLFDPQKNLDENISALFFRRQGYLYEEPENLLAQEFRNTAIYSDIISSIASGCCRLHEISSKTHLDPASVSYALKNLIATGIASKETAITDEKNRKKVQYVLKDSMFRFWYQFIPDAVGAIEMDEGDAYYQNIVRPRLPEYMGKVFEDICRFYTLKIGLKGELNCYVTSVGRWWGTNPHKKQPTDIDVVGLDTRTGKAVLGECKFRNTPLDKKMYEDLTDRNGLISHQYVTVQYLLFSKSGFSDWIHENTDPEMVRLISLEEMYLL